MIYRFTIISDEVDDFVREIQIDPEATFFDFHEAILKSVGYTNDQMTSFFICDDDWEKGKEVTLEEKDHTPKQTIDFEEMAAASSSLDLDENFYGDQDFDMEDFDQEGFDIGGNASSSYEEEKF